MNGAPIDYQPEYENVLRIGDRRAVAQSTPSSFSYGSFLLNWRPAFDKLDEISRLNDGWNGRGAKKIPERAISEARKFLYRINGYLQRETPFLAPDAEEGGGVAISWTGKDSNTMGRKLDVSIFAGDCYAEYYLKRVGENPEIREVKTMDELFAAVARYFS